MKRNLKNINHWVAEVRRIAFESKRCFGLDGEPMDQEQINWVFSKSSLENSFKNGDTPQEAFEDEMEEWANNQDGE